MDFLALRVGFRFIIFSAMAYYRYKMKRLESVKDKRWLLFRVIMVYFICVCLHNDEITYTWIGKKDLATQCYGMLPFLTLQMAWMMVALRPPLAQVRLLLIWVACVYFITGKIFEIS